jgi:hypothetical protein
MHWLHGFPYRQAIHLRSGRNGVVFDQHLTAICDLLDVGRDMQAIVAKLVQLHAVLVVHHADRLAWNESQASNVGGRRRRGLDLHPRLSHGGASRAHAEQEQGAAAVLRAQGPDRAMVSRCGWGGIRRAHRRRRGARSIANHISHYDKMRAVDSVEAQRPNRNGPQRKRMRWHYDYLKKLMWEQRRQESTRAPITKVRMQAAAISD